MEIAKNDKLKDFVEVAGVSECRLKMSYDMFTIYLLLHFTIGTLFLLFTLLRTLDNLRVSLISTVLVVLIATLANLKLMRQKSTENNKNKLMVLK